MTWLRVITPGLRSAVQDAGFLTGRDRGVPVCGAMDGEALRLVNALLGNPPGTEAIEAALTAPVLEAEGGTVRLALSASLSGRIVSPDGPTRPVTPLTTASLAVGQRLILDAPAHGGYGLIGVQGGFDLPRVFGSRSTCLRAGFGGFQGRALQAGDRLPVARPAAAGAERRFSATPPETAGPIGLVPGPQDEWFAEDAFAALAENEWVVGAECDRMGMRLQGAPLAFAPGRTADIVSDGIVPGAIQVPGSGQPIVLLADAQTTGGYAKIATVIRADLPRLSRYLPGDRIRFAWVTVGAAEEIAARREEALARTCASVADLAGATVPDSARLLAENLVGGMVDMQHPDHFAGHLGPAGQEDAE